MNQDDERAAQIHEAIDLMIRAMRCHHRGIERQLSQKGLHRSQRMILHMLSMENGTLSQRQLADRFDISPACVARSLKTMTAEGYISRSGDAADQRRNRVSVTEKGLRVVEETRRTLDSFDQAAFEGFNGDELQCLIALLTRFQDNLKQYEDPRFDPPRPSKGSAF